MWPPMPRRAGNAAARSPHRPRRPLRRSPSPDLYTCASSPTNAATASPEQRPHPQRRSLYVPMDLPPQHHGPWTWSKLLETVQPPDVHLTAIANKRSLLLRATFMAVALKVPKEKTVPVPKFHSSTQASIRMCSHQNKKKQGITAGTP
ncbi:uncharacterized protein [Miscanthus floridulus]|uniref:uncharacterized protein n=1 Tax=Miscanthus floridulus TaxID=154761 RepID=UPI003459EE6E